MTTEAVLLSVIAVLVAYITAQSLVLRSQSKKTDEDTEGDKFIRGVAEKGIANSARISDLEATGRADKVRISDLLEKVDEVKAEMVAMHNVLTVANEQLVTANRQLTRLLLAKNTDDPGVSTEAASAINLADQATDAASAL